MDNNDIDRLLDNLLLMSEPIVLSDFFYADSIDPGDPHVLSLAVQGRANAIVTHNIRDFIFAVDRYGIELFTPAQAFAILEKR